MTVSFDAIDGTESPELIDIIVEVEIRLQHLGWIEVQQTKHKRTVQIKNDRLAKWMLAAIERSGQPEAVMDLVHEGDTNLNWWLMKQFLPLEAWETLSRNLKGVEAA